FFAGAVATVLLQFATGSPRCFPLVLAGGMSLHFAIPNPSLIGCVQTRFPRWAGRRPRAAPPRGGGLNLLRFLGRPASLQRSRREYAGPGHSRLHATASSA